MADTLSDQQLALFLGSRRRENLCSPSLRDPHRGQPNAASRRMDQRALAFSQTDNALQPVERSQEGHRQRRRSLGRHSRRYRREHPRRRDGFGGRTRGTHRRTSGLRPRCRLRPDPFRRRCQRIPARPTRLIPDRGRAPGGHRGSSDPQPELRAALHPRAGAAWRGAANRRHRKYQAGSARLPQVRRPGPRRRRNSAAIEAPIAARRGKRPGRPNHGRSRNTRRRNRPEPPEDRDRRSSRRNPGVRSQSPRQGPKVRRRPDAGRPTCRLRSPRRPPGLRGPAIPTQRRRGREGLDQTQGRSCSE